MTREEYVEKLQKMEQKVIEDLEDTISFISLKIEKAPLFIWDDIPVENKTQFKYILNGLRKKYPFLKFKGRFNDFARYHFGNSWISWKLKPQSNESI